MPNNFYKIIGLITGLITFANCLVFAQGVAPSPYSQFGIGDIEAIGNVRQQATGGVGVSLPNSLYGNPINPALTAYNRNYVIFDAAFYGQSDIIKSRTQSQQIITGNINYLSILFPVTTRNWTISVGLHPFSNANTRFLSLQNTVPTYNNIPVSDTASTNANILYNNVSEGGLNQVYMSHGIKLPKGLAIGLSINYIFGSITRNSRIIPVLKDQATQTQITSKEQYRLLEFKPGIAYYKKLTSDYNLNIGATATFSSDIGSSRLLTNSIVIESKGDNRSSIFIPIYTDTFQLDDRKVALPTQYKLGFSIDKNNKWNIGLDYTFSNYRSYTAYDRTNVFDDSHRLAIGGEVIPDYNALKGYLKRMVYRYGAYYYITPLELNQTKITEFAGTLGLGLPFGKGGTTSLNLAVTIGQRGTIENNLVQENFVRFFVGLNINDRWFVRYKLD